MAPVCSSQTQPKLIAQLLVLVALCLSTAQAHRHRRHHHLLSGHHFVVKIALNECPIPAHCRPHVEKALLSQSKVPECDAIDYFELLKCLDREIMSRTNVTDLNSKAGRVCCETEDVSPTCQNACRSALYAPTLSHELKMNRIQTVCNRQHGDEVKGDNGVLNCLATTSQWLVQKHKVMRR